MNSAPKTPAKKRSLLGWREVPGATFRAVGMIASRAVSAVADVVETGVAVVVRAARMIASPAGSVVVRGGMIEVGVVAHAVRRIASPVVSGVAPAAAKEAAGAANAATTVAGAVPQGTRTEGTANTQSIPPSVPLSVPGTPIPRAQQRSSCCEP